MTSKYHQRLGLLCLVTVIAETLLVILSWLLSAMRVEGIRSLLSSEGIRWFFSSFNDLIASPVLVWLLVLMCALGCLQKSRVTTIFSGKKSINFRDRLALYVALAFLLIYVVIILLLTLMPHAILLSATGHLFPSAFSRSLVPPAGIVLWYHQGSPAAGVLPLCSTVGGLSAFCLRLTLQNETSPLLILFLLSQGES